MSLYIVIVHKNWLTYMSINYILKSCITMDNYFFFYGMTLLREYVHILFFSISTDI
jgi:hypothetical protein